MSRFRGEGAERLIKGLALAGFALGLIGSGWLAGQRESHDEVARLNGKINAMVNDQVESCLVKQSTNAGSPDDDNSVYVATYDFGSLVCDTPEQAKILMSSSSLRKRIVGRICYEGL